MAQIVGFIGLGIMGRPMSKHLVKAGYDLIVHDPDRDAFNEHSGVSTLLEDLAGLGE